MSRRFSPGLAMQLALRAFLAWTNRGNRWRGPDQVVREFAPRTMLTSFRNHCSREFAQHISAGSQAVQRRKPAASVLVFAGPRVTGRGLTWNQGSPRHISSCGDRFKSRIHLCRGEYRACGFRQRLERLRHGRLLPLLISLIKLAVQRPFRVRRDSQRALESIPEVKRRSRRPGIVT